MNWLARQPFGRVAGIAAAWPFVAATTVYLGMEVYTRWLIWRDTRDARVAYYAFSFHTSGARGLFVVAALTLPPAILLVTWWFLRRDR